MILSQTIAGQVERASWIRRMFEEGARLKAERGAANIFDFTLGNPDVDPPPEVLTSLRRVAADSRPGRHGYMPNAGYPHVREAVARHLRESTGLEFSAEDVFMTVGSSGAANVALKILLDPGDEVIVLMPCFSEYPFYVLNHAGRMVPVETDDEFLPDPARIAAAVTPRTKVLILNSPNNPTGRVYPRDRLEEIERILAGLDHPVIVLSDEPYKPIVFDGVQAPEVAGIIRRTLIASSWSKTFALAGERIGYLALSPRLEERQALRDACVLANRALGYINAPAIWQRVIAETIGTPVDMQCYQRRRDLLCDGLLRAGYQLRKPEGTFYVFPKSPIPDDIAFIRVLAAEGALGVPGTGFGRSGYFRLSLTVPDETIEKALPVFERARRACLSRTPR